MEEQHASVKDLMNKISEFEVTVSALLENIRAFKSKILDLTNKYGADTTKWPAIKD